MITYSQFLQAEVTKIGKGPVALIFAEDPIEVDGTIRHHVQLGFARVVAFLAPGIDPPTDLPAQVTLVQSPQIDLAETVTACIQKMPANTWVYYCYNAEYLYFPFCETRTIGELLAFHTEERRDAMMSFVIDLYAPDLEQNPQAVSISNARLDRSGYYALARPDPDNHNHPKERQLDFFGGLRWRYEEHIPKDRRRIDRVSIFKTKPGLTLASDFTFSDQEYNTYACQWHHNLTAAVCSFRTAKALKSNPGSRHDINSFVWHNSIPFAWHSQQLLDLGLIETGQWF
jgi:hypothetical protein